MRASFLATIPFHLHVIRSIVLTRKRAAGEGAGGEIQSQLDRERRGHTDSPRRCPILFDAGIVDLKRVASMSLPGALFHSARANGMRDESLSRVNDNPGYPPDRLIRPMLTLFSDWTIFADHADAPTPAKGNCSASLPCFAHGPPCIVVATAHRARREARKK